MRAKRRQQTEQNTPITFDPLNEPRTIPTGWDVSTFYKSERIDEHYSSQFGRTTFEASRNNGADENTKNTL